MNLVLGKDGRIGFCQRHLAWGRIRHIYEQRSIASYTQPYRKEFLVTNHCRPMKHGNAIFICTDQRKGIKWINDFAVRDTELT